MLEYMKYNFFSKTTFIRWVYNLNVQKAVKISMKETENT